jgi:YD repeat-containing protein
MRAVAADNYTYANPHALTGYFNGIATTTYSYDAIGNLATTTGAATSTFNWDYRNRMIRAALSGNFSCRRPNRERLTSIRLQPRAR